MIKNFYWSLLLLISASAFAGDGEYSVARISPDLLKNAHVVVRKHLLSVEIKSLDKMVIRETEVLTVLDEKGDDLAYMAESYDRFNSIESMDGTLYDAMGKKIKSVKKADIKDESTASDMSLAEEGRLKYHSFYYKNYPYTVEYETEVVKRHTMFMPNWAPVPTEHVSVEKSAMVVEVPKDYQLRYKCFNCTDPVVTNNDKKMYRWELSNFNAITREYASPAWHKIVPYLVLAPSDFQIEDYKGNMTDWNELGKFALALNKGLDVLPPAIQQKVHQLIEGKTTTEEKVKVLYDFLQHSTRYISVQLGIGGWRPYDPAYVSSKGYGDCKALSNYMVALLKEAGIPAYYTLIRGGSNEEDIITEFPSEQFNHVIACVPNGKDTIWLECTSSLPAAGYMGNFTGNRHALLITENGGKLVSTPHYGARENTRVRNITATIAEDGKLSAVVRSSYGATEGESLYGLADGYTKDRIKDYLKERISLPTFDITDFHYKENRSTLPSIDETLDIVAENYATVSGKRLFIVPNVFSKFSSRLDVSEERKYDIELKNESTMIDSVEITIPAGYQLEALAADNKLDCKYGKYITTLKIAENKVVYTRRLEMYRGQYPAKEYADLSKFYDQVYKADRGRVVLVKKEQ